VTLASHWIEVQRAAVEPITKPVKIDTCAGPPSEYEPEVVKRCLERLGQEGAFDGTLFGDSRSLRFVGIEHPSGRDTTHFLATDSQAPLTRERLRCRSNHPKPPMTETKFVSLHRREDPVRRAQATSFRR
jgi:hypothetical protein